IHNPTCRRDISFLLPHLYRPRDTRRDRQSGNGGIAGDQHSPARPFDLRNRRGAGRACRRRHGADHERRSADGRGIPHPSISFDSGRWHGHAAWRVGGNGGNLGHHHHSVGCLDASCGAGGRGHYGHCRDPAISAGHYRAPDLTCAGSPSIRRSPRPSGWPWGLASLILNEWSLTQLAQYMAYGIFAMALAFIWGQAGILSFGQASFFGIGGYCMGLVTLGQLPLVGDSTFAGLLLALVVPSI